MGWPWVAMHFPNTSSIDTKKMVGYALQYFRPLCDARYTSVARMCDIGIPRGAERERGEIKISEHNLLGGLLGDYE